MSQPLKINQREPKALCVSIHDVAPATWPACQKLLRAIQAVAPIPVTLLVVPHYHRSGRRDYAYERELEARLACGDELALHGYTHLDEGPPPRVCLQPWQTFKRQVFTRNEGEFAALTTQQARQRLDRGLAWFAKRAWPLEGFVAPAWLLSDGAWQALQAAPIRYTTTFWRFYQLPQGHSLVSPSLVYSARNEWLRQGSKAWCLLLANGLQRQPLIRLSLHPPDAERKDIVVHAQKLIEQLLLSRKPMTKAAFARTYRHWTHCGEKMALE